MLSKNQEKIIKQLQTKKGREKYDRCLVEGEKVIAMAEKFVDYVFYQKDTKNFSQLATTETPQDLVAVAKIPKFSLSDVRGRKVVVVLDGVQDPGNVGAILRLCLGFDAGLVLVESADPTAPKVVRSSVGALFAVPWVVVPRAEAENYLKNFGGEIYRLEKRPGALDLAKIKFKKPLMLVAGAEGNGIKMAIAGRSVFINHHPKLESLNVSQAVAIVLFSLY